jgi:hypothetical protein
VRACQKISLGAANTEDDVAVVSIFHEGLGADASTGDPAVRGRRTNRASVATVGGLGQQRDQNHDRERHTQEQ